MEEEVELDSILETVRAAMGLDLEDNSFDHEIVLHINGALATLYQNGVGLPLVVKNRDQLWDELRDPKQVLSDYMFEQIKLYVFIKTKILFDPPPPSTATYMNANIDELLWRLRESYDIVREETGLDGTRRIEINDPFRT